MKISAQLVMGFLLISALVLIVGVVSTAQSQKTLEKSIGESYAVLSQEILNNIDRGIYNRIERWKSYIFSNPELLKTLIESNQEFEKLDNIQEHIDKKDMEWVSAPKETITPFMQDILNNKLSEGLEKRIKFHEEEGYTVFGEVIVTNKYSANVAQTGKTPDYSHADEDWWQNAKKDGLYIADVVYDKSTDAYSIDIGIRIDDENGNFLGAMKVILNIEEIIHRLKESGEHETTKLRLLTKDGKIIYSTEEFKFFEDVPDELLEHIFNNQGEKTRKDHLMVQSSNLEEENLFVCAHSRGYNEYKGLGWILVVEYGAEEIFAPVFRLRNFILVTLSILVSFFVAHSITRPIIQLREATRDISMGKLDRKIGIKSNDEMEELASAFNEMAKI